MVTIYNYAFTMLVDCIVTVFELLNHIHNSHKIYLESIFLNDIFDLLNF